MKKYLTANNIDTVVLIIGITILSIVVFFSRDKNSDTLDMLHQNQRDIEKLTWQLQKNDNENRQRDSALFAAFERNTAVREQTLNKAKQSANEKIDHINDAGFTADSIARWFANN
jgi:hypothetical protein